MGWKKALRAKNYIGRWSLTALLDKEPTRPSSVVPKPSGPLVCNPSPERCLWPTPVLCCVGRVPVPTPAAEAAVSSPLLWAGSLSQHLLCMNHVLKMREFSFLFDTQNRELGESFKVGTRTCCIPHLLPSLALGKCHTSWNNLHPHPCLTPTSSQFSSMPLSLRRPIVLPTPPLGIMMKDSS